MIKIIFVLDRHTDRQTDEQRKNKGGAVNDKSLIMYHVKMY